MEISRGRVFADNTIKEIPLTSIPKFVHCRIVIYPNLVSELGRIFGQSWSRERQIHDMEMLVSLNKEKRYILLVVCASPSEREVCSSICTLYSFRLTYIREKHVKNAIG